MRVKDGKKLRKWCIDGFASKGMSQTACLANTLTILLRPCQTCEDVVRLPDGRAKACRAASSSSMRLFFPLLPTLRHDGQFRYVVNESIRDSSN